MRQLSFHNGLQVVDFESKKVLGANERGEIWIKGPQVMLGYLGDSAATKQAIDDDGWLHTGENCYYLLLLSLLLLSPLLLSVLLLSILLLFILLLSALLLSVLLLSILSLSVLLLSPLLLYLLL